MLETGVSQALWVSKEKASWLTSLSLSLSLSLTCTHTFNHKNCMHAHRLIHICSSEKKMMIEKDEKKRAVSEMFRLIAKKIDD